MRSITLSELRSNYSSVFQSVERKRRPVLVTRDGVPFVVIQPVSIGDAEEERGRAEGDARDLEILNRSADELNKDALDGLEEQADIFREASEGKAKKKSRSRHR